MVINVGKKDRIIRAVVGTAFAYVAIEPSAILTNEDVRIFIGVWSLINFITAITGFCPMYSLASLSTNKK